MQKLTEFLEKHVQWLAIGLGALFALYMAYGYVFQSPVKVNVGNETFGPGEISSHTQEGVAKDIAGKIHAPSSLKLDVPSNAQQFKDRMAWKGAESVTLANIWTPRPVELPPEMKMQPPNIPNIPGTTVENPPGTTPPPPVPAGQNAIAALPAVPMPKYVADRVGRSVVMPPGAAAQPAAGPNGQVILPAGAMDMEWVTQLWRVSVGDLDRLFKQASIPDPFYSTAIIDVEVVRQELSPNGEPVPGTETPVKLNPALMNPANNGANGQPAIPPLPYPADNATVQDKMQYLQWALGNIQYILEPPFFQVVKGDPWAPAGLEAVGFNGAQPQEAAFDPATTKLRPDQMTKEQKDLWLIWKKQEAAKKAEEQRQKRQSQPRPTPTPRGGGRPGGGAPGAAGGALYAARDSARPAPPTAPPRDRTQGGTDGVGSIGGAGPTGVIGAAGAPVAAPPPQYVVPQPGQNYPAGEFKPNDPQWQGKDIDIWVHDTNVAAGKTYRYKMRYRIKNPIFNVQGNIAKDPEMTKKLGLESEWSEWTKPVTVPATTNFYIVNGMGQNSATARFQVITWKEGALKSTTISVAPGDQVGGPSGGVDYSTGWTVVAFQVDERTKQVQVLLVDPQGNIISRSYQSDQADPLYKSLKDQIATANGGTAAPGAAGAPGAPNPGYINPAVIGGH